MHTIAHVFRPILLVLVGWSLVAGEAQTDVTAQPGWDDLPPIKMEAATAWPWWRGVTCDGQAAPGQEPVQTWGEQTHVRWRTQLSGSGHGTPCISGGCIYLAAGDAKAGVIWVMAYEQASGKKLWQTEVHRGALPRMHSDNSPASATIACDGERLFFPYQTASELHMAALDLTGKVVWDHSYGAHGFQHGFSSSPALYRSAVLLAVDGGERKHITALHRKTGARIWRTGRSGGRDNYASAVVARIAGREQVVVPGPATTRSYDPMTGTMLWQCAGPAETCGSTPAFSSDTVFVVGGYPNRTLLAIRADGSGEVTASHLRWKDAKKSGYIPSPIYHDGLLYEMIDTGVFRCHDAVQGTLVWEHTINAQFYSSPVLVGNRIYIFDRRGSGYVFKTGRECQLLATNELASGAFATPVFLGGRMYLRTLSAMYCIAAP